MRRTTPILLLVLAACASGPASIQSAPLPQSRYVIQPSEGERLRFCDTPELTVTIKVDSVRTGATRFVMGTAELTTQNFGRHRGEDEIIYFTKGRGRAVVGEDTVAFQPGTTMYVPANVRHGFINTGREPVKFVWFMAPRGLEQRFREGAAPPGTQCPSPVTR